MKVSIIFANATICTGSCKYCTARLDANLVNPTTVTVDTLKAINNKLTDLIQFDYEKLEQKIISHPGAEEHDWIFSIWGGDPLASFDCFVDLYEFLNDLGKKYNKRVAISGSTNGLFALNNDYVDWLVSKDNIHMQLSHDGLGQWIRSNIDPLTLPRMEELWNKRILTNINCVLNELNFSPKKNIAYYDQFPYTHNIRIYSARDEKYTIPITADRINGVLLDKPITITNACIHNDSNYPELAHAADIFFDEYYWMGEQIRLGKLKKYANSYIRRIRDVVKAAGSYPDCASYHLGLKDYSNCIDTLGEFTECHLLDHTQHIPNKEMKKPEKCNNCRFKDSHECNYCGRVNISDWECQHNYRLNLWALHFKDLTNNKR